MKRIEAILTSIVGGLPPASLPLGGGAAIVNALAREWSKESKFDITVLGTGEGSDAAKLYPSNVRYVPMPIKWPAGLGADSLTNLSAFQYGNIARQFESVATGYVLERAAAAGSRRVCVICNDICEGVDFRRVARSGVPIVTIFNVDAVDYFTRFYLRSLARPETFVRWYDALAKVGLARCLPGILRLVFEKQADCVRYSKRIIVPSRPMKEITGRCYPWKSPDEIVVIPWGTIDEPAALQSAADTARIREEIRSKFKLSGDEFVLLTLSRLSREKGLGTLLRALQLWEEDGGKTVGRVRLFVCGEAAYMGGERYKRKLFALAQRLRCVRVHFVGHVTGARKQAFFELADLYVMPSRHESYGLTLVEAMRAGLPVLTTNHYSAAEIVGDGNCGLIVASGGERETVLALRNGLKELLTDKNALERMGAAAARLAQTMQFSDAAVKIGEMVGELV